MLKLLDRMLVFSLFGWVAIPLPSNISHIIVFFATELYTVAKFAGQYKWKISAGRPKKRSRIS
jgi:hypothetical protein